MIYYCGLIFLIFIFREASSFFKDCERKAFFLPTALTVILFQGLRSFSVGTDLSVYIPAYEEIGKEVALSFNMKYLNFETGYVLLNKLLYLAGFGERAFLITVTIIIQAPIFYVMYKYSARPLLSVTSYFAFGNFIVTFSGLRQGIAMSLCFAAYVFIKNKKIVRFILITLIACFFHKSAVLCFVLYPLYYVKIKKTALPFVLFGVALCFLFKEQIVRLLSYVYYGKGAETEPNGSYTMFFMYLVLYVVSIFISGSEEKSGIENILLLLVCIYSLSSIHETIARTAFPLSLYLSLLIPEIVAGINAKTEKDGLIMNILCNALCVACFLFFVGNFGTLPFGFL